MTTKMNHRRFLELMGAGVAGAMLSGCYGVHSKAHGQQKAMSSSNLF